MTLAGRRLLGYTTAAWATGVAERANMTAEGHSGLQSGPAMMFDGSWGYWTAHDIKSHDSSVLGNDDDKKGHDGIVLLPGGRALKGDEWRFWDTSAGCDLKHPTIWTSRNCRSKWKWQVSMYGGLTDRFPSALCLAARTPDLPATALGLQADHRVSIRGAHSDRRRLAHCH